MNQTVVPRQTSFLRNASVPAAVIASMWISITCMYHLPTAGHCIDSASQLSQGSRCMIRSSLSTTFPFLTVNTPQEPFASEQEATAFLLQYCCIGSSSTMNLHQLPWHFVLLVVPFFAFVLENFSFLQRKLGTWGKLFHDVVKKQRYSIGRRIVARHVEQS